MASAIDVARFLIELAKAEDEPEQLSHLRLQKLLYYVQGWSLALRDQPMFDDKIEAWVHGPVVPSVYPEFADFGFQTIPPDEVPSPDALAPEEKQFIESVWEAYREHSANSLRRMTHQEPPWLEARGGCGPADRCGNEITHASMKAFFSSTTE